MKSVDNDGGWDAWLFSWWWEVFRGAGAGGGSWCMRLSRFAGWRRWWMMWRSECIVEFMAIQTVAGMSMYFRFNIHWIHCFLQDGTFWSLVRYGSHWFAVTMKCIQPLFHWLVRRENVYRVHWQVEIDMIFWMRHHENQNLSGDILESIRFDRCCHGGDLSHDVGTIVKMANFRSLLCFARLVAAYFRVNVSI